MDLGTWILKLYLAPFPTHCLDAIVLPSKHPPMYLFRLITLVFLCLFVIADAAFAQITPAPDRTRGEGPYERLILRGGILIDGTGAPPIGPVDIVVEQDRIVRIAAVGYPGGPEGTLYNQNRPAAGERELDVSGMYILPGFVDMHGHIGGLSQGTPAEYVLKLWLAHGITTVRDPGSGNGIDWTLGHREKSAANTIAAPRIFAYVRFGMGAESPIVTPDDARNWVRFIKNRGADGIKFGGAAPELLQAALDEAGNLGLGTAMHHAQLYVARANVAGFRNLGTHHDGALVRPAGSALHRSYCARLSARIQLSQRAAPVWRSRPIMATSRAPVLSPLERGHGFTHQPGLHHRSNHDHL